MISIAVLLTRVLRKPEQDWYRCRAVAESVKTLTWRYVMRAAPFGGAFQAARAEFRNHLQKLFDENKTTAEKFAHDWAAEEQITPEMDRIRGLPLAERKDFYLTDRIQDQRLWYAHSARKNKASSTIWAVVGVTSYAIAVALALSRIRFPDWQLWPIEPVIVLPPPSSAGRRSRNSTS